MQDELKNRYNRANEQSTQFFEFAHVHNSHASKTVNAGIHNVYW